MRHATMTDRDDCIVARKPCCGRIVYASVADPSFFDDAAKKELAEMVIAGYKIEHLTPEEVRAADWGCKCLK